MPAIDLARLKIQAANLAESFGDPPAFLRGLTNLLEFYTNRTMRSSQVARKLSLPTFHTPAPVLRQVERELAPLASSMPAEAIALTEALWTSSSLESRLLAARLLGAIPLTQAVPALARLPGWLAQSTDRVIRAAILGDSLARLREENPQAFFVLLEEWLCSPRSALQVWGMRALIPLLSQSGFENLPAVFRILRPAVLMAGPSTQPDLQACLLALQTFSTIETLGFLQEIIHDHPNPMMLRTLRRILPSLHPDLQAGLRDLLREHS